MFLAGIGNKSDRAPMGSYYYSRSPGWQEQISENRFRCGVVARAMFPRDQASARRFDEWREQN